MAGRARAKASVSPSKIGASPSKIGVVRSKQSKSEKSAQDTAALTTNTCVTQGGDVKTKAKKLNPKLAETFVSRTLSKGVLALTADFRAEKKSNDLTKMTAFSAHMELNRYKDVGCLDANRVELSCSPTSDYIHANYVAGHENPRRFICTQAPLLNTIADFWHMVVQEKSKLVVMLCNFKEQGATKCSDYFPVTTTRAVEDGRVSVTALTIKKFPLKSKGKIDIISTELDVRVPGKAPHTCTHLHWKDWPDRGVPPTDFTPIDLCEYMSGVSLKSVAPIVVHCSAGIGRTGSIVLIDLLLEQLRYNVPWDEDLKGCLKRLRRQRNNSVQTEHQYLYVHMIMLNYFINSLMSTKDRESQPQLLQKYNKFKEEYDKYCKGF